MSQFSQSEVPCDVRYDARELGGKIDEAVKFGLEKLKFNDLTFHTADKQRVLGVQKVANSL